MNLKLKMLAGLTLPILISCNQNTVKKESEKTNIATNYAINLSKTNDPNVCQVGMDQEEKDFLEIRQFVSNFPIGSDYADLEMYWEEYKLDGGKSLEPITGLIHSFHYILLDLNSKIITPSDEFTLKVIKFMEHLKLKALGIANSAKFEYELFSHSILANEDKNNQDTTFANSVLERSAIEMEARNMVASFVEAVEKIKKDNNLPNHYVLMFNELHSNYHQTVPVTNANTPRGSVSSTTSSSSGGSSDSSASTGSSNLSENSAVHFTADPVHPEVTFINTGNATLEASDKIIVKVQDRSVIKKLQQFKEYFSKNIDVLKPHIKAENHNLVLDTDFNEGLVLNAGLAVTAIFDYLEYQSDLKKRKEAEEKRLNLKPGSLSISDIIAPEEKTLYHLLAAHSYLSFTQMAIDGVQATADIINLYKTLSNTSIKQQIGVYAKLGRVVNAASNIIGGISVALDIAEVMQAKTATEKIQFSTQLAFDSLGLGLGITNLVLRSMGAMTASSVVGAISVPLAGLAVGLTGFASASARAQEEAVVIARYLFDYEKDHYIYNPTPLNTTPAVLPLPYKQIEMSSDLKNINKAEFANVVIKALDLSHFNRFEVKYGTHRIYETDHNLSIDGCVFFCNVKAHTHKDRTLKIKDELKFPTKEKIEIFDVNTAVILPIVPESYITYGYNYTPWITTRKDAELTTFRKLQNTGKFRFEYYGPLLFDNAIRYMNSEFIDTEVEVKLGEFNRTMITPHMPELFYGKMNYKFLSSDGNYYLKVRDTAKYELVTTGEERWFIDATEIINNFEDFIITQTNIKLGNLVVNFPTGKQPKELIFALKDGTMYFVDLLQKKKKLIVVDFHKFAQNYPAHLEKLEQLTANDQGFVELENYKISQGVIKAWYDINRKDIFYPNNPLSDFDCQKNKACFDMTSVLLLERKENEILYYSDAERSLYYQENINSPMKLAANHILRIHRREDQSFIIENSSNHAFIFSVDHTKTLVALKKTLVTAEEIKNIAIENSCEIAEKVSIYNHDGRFVGEYDKEKDMITYINEMGGEKEIKEKSNKSWNLMFM